MGQLNLPLFPVVADIPPQHLTWLIQANSMVGWQKKVWFYPFKSRFVRQYGQPDGLDLQVIVDKCYCGDGTFRGIDRDRPSVFWERCNRCSGTGIYRRRKIMLRRFKVNDHVFHEPAVTIHWHLKIEYHEKIEGLIKHDPVPDSVAIRAMLRLFLRYEPRTFLRWWHSKWCSYRDTTQYKVTRQMQRTTASVKRLLRIQSPEVLDEIPF